MEEEGSIETSDASVGKDGTSPRESMPELMNSSLGITVTREDSMVSGDTSGSDPTGSKGLGHGGESW